eukprot:SAG22_NODE_12345_length_446_cov_0.795389_1_plen_71_part_10
MRFHNNRKLALRFLAKAYKRKTTSELKVRHCLSVVPPLSSDLRQCLSLRSVGLLKLDDWVPTYGAEQQLTA